MRDRILVGRVYVYARDAIVIARTRILILSSTR